MTEVIDQGQDRLVDELYVWVCVNPKTQLESVVAIEAGGQKYPLIVTSFELAQDLKEAIYTLKESTGKDFKLISFCKPEVVETI
jgi:hypothetical protein